MSNRPQQLTLPPLRTHSRTEFRALRACGRLPIATIARLHFDAGTTERLDVERLLRTMRDDLVARAAGRIVGARIAPAGVNREVRR
ncbi:hypothetical protein WJ33_23515 [Burkholderia ubonensis]|uniref:Uncharacterized protein n=1 Tax=Burkholderia ubonensis TaxID=101571 RepID=A0A103RJ88_9BURK|nr:hypothetical protein WJ33_23515 [Burkholderia ubonensis]